MAGTTYMKLYKPTVGVTMGPDWATALNTLIDVIDAHDHSSDKGARVGQAGIVLTGDLSAFSHRLIDLLSLRFVDSSGGAANAGEIYVQNGDLYYHDVNGTAIQITKNGLLNATTLTGFSGDYGQPGVTATAFYTNATRLYEFFSSTGPSVYGHLKLMDLFLRGALKLSTNNVVTKAADYVVTDVDNVAVILVDTNAARNITLPAAVTNARVLELKDKSGLAMTNNISVIPNGADTIEGLNATKALATNWGSWKLVSDGVSGWYML